VALLTPQGTVARYFNGIGIAPAELRTALDDAAQGRTGRWTDRLALLCSHFAASTGRYTASVMGVLRAVSLLTLAALGAVAWRHLRKGDVA
jgi:protein SCO1/2